MSELVTILDSRRIPINAEERAKRVGAVPYYGSTGQVGWIDKALFDEELVLLGEDAAPFLDPFKNKAYIVSGPTWVNNHAHVLRPRDHLLSRFLLHQLNTVDYRQYVTGSTRLKLPQAAMRAIPLVVPPLAEQRHIVAAVEAHLSDLDAAVACLERARANSLRLTAGLYASTISTCGRTIPTAADTSLPFSLPDSWEWKTLGEVVGSIEAGASYRCDERPPNAGEIGIVKVSAVTWGTYDDAESKTIRSNDRADASLLVRKGDFLFSRANTLPLVGACVVAERIDRAVMLSDKILRFHFKNSVDAWWVLCCLRSDWGRHEIERLSTGNQESMRNIGQARIREIRIPCPPIDEQLRRVEVLRGELDATAGIVEDIEKCLARAKRLRQAVLRAAFSGELVPQDASVSKASALSERVLASEADSSIPVNQPRVRAAKKSSRRRSNA